MPSVRILEIEIIMISSSTFNNYHWEISLLYSNNYLSGKLLDSKTSPKSYWSTLKTFLYNKKIPCIPTLLHNGSFIKNFIEKTELFNDFFSKQCSLVNNNSKLPSVLTKKTCKSLSSFEFSTYNILKIMRNLNLNKAHGHDMISIWMLKICDESICKPLGITFRSCLENGKFPSEWKKTSVVPVLKKAISKS